MVDVCCVAYDEHQGPPATPHSKPRHPMPPRTVWAVFHKAYLASGVVHKDYTPLFLSLLLDRGPCLALGCPLYIRRPLLAPLQSIRFSPSPLLNISLLTYTRFIASIHLGSLVRRKTSCGCMRYGLGGHSAPAAYIDISFHSIFSRFWSASNCLFSCWSTQWRSGSTNFFVVP